MKPRLLVTLLICATLLAGCYRQAEEPFQQIDSAEVLAEATSTAVLADDEVSEDRAGDDGTSQTTTPGEYITPETVPGQIELTTVELPTGEAAEAIRPVATLAPFERPTATRTFEEELDPNDECVYTVQAGNVLFRLALAWGTTYQTIMEVNQMDSEDLAIGQLLLIPDCESSEPAASATEAPVTAGAVEISAEEEAEAEPAAEEEAAEPTAEPEPTAIPEPTATPLPEIHVVSAGETIESISLRYRVDVNELIALNEITDRNRLSVGQELKLPQG